VAEAVQAAAAFFGFMFVAAGVGKLDAWRDWRDVLQKLLPTRSRLRTIATRVLPVTEIACGCLAIVRPSEGVLACGALLLALGGGASFFSFSHRGEACKCFGALMPSEIGPRLAVRNIILGLSALPISYYARRHSIGGLTGLEIVVALLAFVLLLCAIALRSFHHLSSSRLAR
jgi:hypothetical protein